MNHLYQAEPFIVIY